MNPQLGIVWGAWEAWEEEQYCSLENNENSSSNPACSTVGWSPVLCAFCCYCDLSKLHCQKKFAVGLKGSLIIGIILDCLATQNLVWIERRMCSNKLPLRLACFKQRCATSRLIQDEKITIKRLCFASRCCVGPLERREDLGKLKTGWAGNSSDSESSRCFQTSKEQHDNQKQNTIVLLWSSRFEPFWKLHDVQDVAETLPSPRTHFLPLKSPKKINTMQCNLDPGWHNRASRLNQIR